MQSVTEEQSRAYAGRNDIAQFLAERTARIPVWAAQSRRTRVAATVLWLAFDAPGTTSAADRLNVSGGLDKD